MSESSTIEIDFFRLQDESCSKKASDRRDIQGVISKINPELLKSAIASASATTSFMANTAFSSSLQLQTPTVAYNQDSGIVNTPVTVAPMTIFFNGTVSVFNVSPTQAESVIKLAECANSGSKNAVESTLVMSSESTPNQGISRVLTNDLPLSRKRSLRMFLEKRKERHVAMSPYACSEGSTSLH